MEIIEISLHKVVKRDGRVVDFDENKIRNAIMKAAIATGLRDKTLAEKATAMVVNKLSESFKGKTPNVEQIQDIVEDVLIQLKQPKIAKAYILYRKKRQEVRKEKLKILNKKALDDVDKAFDVNALKVLASRYLRKDSQGKPIESPKKLFKRVALHVALSDLLHDKNYYDIKAEQHIKPLKDFKELNVESILEKKPHVGEFYLNRYHIKWLHLLYGILNKEHKMRKTFEQVLKDLCDSKADSYVSYTREYYQLMVDRRFMPNTPALVNFGNVHGMGSACFVLDIEDNIGSIMDSLKNAALIFQAGGGCGYNFSKIRPEGDIVKSTTGVASGPVTFIGLYDKMTEVIKQGGVRRGANMGILNIDHPDIENFIRAKEGNKFLKNFNISVLIKPEFWDCLKHSKPYKLLNPRDNTVWREVDAEELLEMIAYQARNYAEPGVLFMDNINKYNPLLDELGPITTTNPCGEVLLYPNEVCNLGSINLSAFINNREVDWDGLANAVKVATRFLDNVIDINNYPLKEIRTMARLTRKIGLGVMGLGDALYKLKVRYDSDEGLQWMERFMEFINYHSKLESIELSKTRGRFPLFDKSFYPKGDMPFAAFYGNKKQLNWDKVVELIKENGLRNTFTIVIAPTGSISMIAGTSSGMEPVFALVFEKRVVVGHFFYVDPVFEQALKQEGLYNEEILTKVSNNKGSIKGIKGLPDWFYDVFVTAMDISPEMHVKAQAAFQRWVDSSISKTINMPATATVQDVKNAYLLAYNLGCKGLTVYRDSSIKEQVLVAGNDNTVNKTNKIEECPACGSKNLQIAEGCVTCLDCGWSKCST